MGKKVYANGMEIAHKAGDAKVMAAFPDVCLSPPPPPTGPVPVPYPNTSFAKDLQEGSSSVTIGGKPIALKDSFYKTSPLGNEAATKNFGGGVLTHTITGATYFQAHSMDVVFEGKNVCRHLDVTGSNCGSDPFSVAGVSAETAAPSKASAEEEVFCPCTSKDGSKHLKHANQKGASSVTEKEWYGEAAYKDVQEARKMGCECVPSEPDKGCGMYYIQPDPGQSHAARTRWESRYKRVFIANWNKAGKSPPLVYQSDGKKEGDRIAHKVPISAGGCIWGEENLMPNKAMSQPCQDMDKKLSDHHNDRAAHFQR